MQLRPLFCGTGNNHNAAHRLIRPAN